MNETGPSQQPPNVEATLARLEGFQRDAVEHCFERLYRAPDASKRFLIADEVGLGKTIIARGIVARAVEHLWDEVDRIDVVYICSNLSIARQNMRRLAFSELTPVDRLTMLPVTVDELDGGAGGNRRLNYFAFTPSTSFEHDSRLGAQRERKLLYHMMQEVWPMPGSGAKNLLQGTVRNRDRWRRSLDDFLDEHEISRELQKAFRRTLLDEDRRRREHGERGLRKWWKDACGLFGYYRRKWPQEHKQERNALIAELRRLLARSCIGALEPDLVILDEFQRFKHLLEADGEGPAAELAQQLFNWQGEREGEAARVLLLSATPYKMYTLAHEAGEDDHYADFLRTVEFLHADGGRTEALRADLEQFRQEIYRLRQEGSEYRLKVLRRRIEANLRLVMSRTERALPGHDGDGMLYTRPVPDPTLETADLHDYLDLERVAQEVGRPGLLELWKSAPYLLSFADTYAFARDLAEQLDGGTASAELPAVVKRARGCRVDPDVLHAYRRLDPRNARLRSLEADVLDTGLWRCLWMPPTQPTYGLEGPFAEAAESGASKRLLFSSWTVVPKTVAALLSYEVERRALEESGDDPVNTPEARSNRSGRLALDLKDGVPAGMPALGMIAPSPPLAWLGDPRSLAHEAGRRLDLRETLGLAVERIERALAPLVERYAETEAVDEAWYWAAPILLDREDRRSGDACRRWWGADDLAERWSWRGEEAGVSEVGHGWRAHVAAARAVVAGRRRLGRPPSDLGERLARLAVGGPANAALRALHRACPGADPHDEHLRTAAARIGWGFRSHFNGVEATAIVRGRDHDNAYWRKVLDYCCAGALGDLLDEHLHVTRDALGLFDAGPEVAAETLASALMRALLRPVTRPEMHAFRFEPGPGPGQPRRAAMVRHPLRGHFAMRFGDGATESDEKGGLHLEDVRAAFNSPFWPFVLASTSVGQEGLDFHPWCHVVVHWNLPPNPVDLEQREGRVHRFKGHAVRKNVAMDHGDSVLGIVPHQDAWQHMFQRARNRAEDDRSGLVPFWIYPRPGGACVERRVPLLPLSRDALRFEALRRSLAVYRMVFGQPRQDDLLAFLLESFPPDRVERLARELRVDLSPAARSQP